MPGTWVEPDVVAAVDIGGTKTAAALVGRQGEVVARAAAATPGADGAAAVLRTASELVLRLTADAPCPVRALGVGSAGVVDAGTGQVLGATAVLAGWAGTDLRGELSRATGLRTAVVNDVHAHALGEARHGAGAGCRTVLFLAVGTGIGGSFVMDGKVLAGAHSAAGHAGHVPSPAAAGRLCSCGGRGHLEAFAAGPALAAEYARRSGRAARDLRAVAAFAGDGDASARAVLADGGAAVGTALGGLVNVLDPHVVLVGGGVSGLGEVWWQPLRAAVRRETLPLLVDVPVLPAVLGHDAALVGAADIAWETAT